MENKEIVYYNGPCSHKVLVDIGNEINNKLENILPQKSIKKVFACSNELVQNMDFYSAERAIIEDKEVGCGEISINYDSEYIYVTASNVIEDNKCKELSRRIEILNNMEELEFKTAYKEQLRSEQAEDSKGAGLGFMEIIKKTKSKILVSCNRNEDITKIKIISVIKMES